MGVMILCQATHSLEMYLPLVTSLASNCPNMLLEQDFMESNWGKLLRVRITCSPMNDYIARDRNMRSAHSSAGSFFHMIVDCIGKSTPLLNSPERSSVSGIVEACLRQQYLAGRKDYHGRALGLFNSTCRRDTTPSRRSQTRVRGASNHTVWRREDLLFELL
jgi:hypothetical protein